MPDASSIERAIDDLRGAGDDTAASLEEGGARAGEALMQAAEPAGDAVGGSAVERMLAAAGAIGDRIADSIVSRLAGVKIPVAVPAGASGGGGAQRPAVTANTGRTMPQAGRVGGPQ
jgi:hypothetical protein